MDVDYNEQNKNVNKLINFTFIRDIEEEKALNKC